MGFLQGFGRLLTGEPIFQAKNQHQPTATAANTQDGSVAQPATPAEIPRVMVTHIKPVIHADALETWALIENASDQTIFLDKIRFLGQTHELDRELQARESYQYLIYKGDALTTKPNDDASVDYRLQSTANNYQARYMVEFGYHHERFIPEQFHLQLPICDI